MIFTALSVLAPAGSRIRSGRKTIEVLSWQPSATLPLIDLLLVQHAEPLGEASSEDPAGSIVAMVDVINIRPWTEDDLEQSTRAEFTTGLFAWELANVRPAAYNRFTPAQQGLFELDLNPKYLLHPDGSLGEAIKDTAREEKEARNIVAAPMTDLSQLG